MGGLLLAVMTVEAVFQVHQAAGTAGSHILGIGAGNILDLFIVDAAGHIVMEQAEAAAKTAAGCGLL